MARPGGRVYHGGMNIRQFAIISIKPQYSRLIFNGTKNYELRKTFMHLQPGDLMLVYESRTTKAVVGYFYVKEFLTIKPSEFWRNHKSKLGITKKSYFEYFIGRDRGFVIEIDRPSKFESKVTLQQLREDFCDWYPPQNFRYVRTTEERRYFLAHMKDIVCEGCEITLTDEERTRKRGEGLCDSCYEDSDGFGEYAFLKKNRVDVT
jgi:predicted transcriptional regulator